MFKPDPKKRVVLKFQSLYGKDIKPVVEGRREEKGMYTVTLGIRNGDDVTPLLTARHRDWRTAYKLLEIALENNYADGKYAV